MSDELSHDEMRAIVAAVESPERHFETFEQGGLLFVRVSYTDTDVDTEQPVLFHGWPIPLSGLRESGQVVQACFKALLTSLEHGAREHFRYRGERVMGPHRNMEAVVAELRRQRAVESVR